MEFFLGGKLSPANVQSVIFKEPSAELLFAVPGGTIAGAHQANGASEACEWQAARSVLCGQEGFRYPFNLVSTRKILQKQTSIIIL